jgi:hypothetical protein
LSVGAPVLPPAAAAPTAPTPTSARCIWSIACTTPYEVCAELLVPPEVPAVLWPDPVIWLPVLPGEYVLPVPGLPVLPVLPVLLMLLPVLPVLPLLPVPLMLLPELPELPLPPVLPVLLKPLVLSAPVPLLVPLPPELPLELLVLLVE